MKLASLCAGIRSAVVKGQLLFDEGVTSGLTVQSILDENAEAMADGGALSDASAKAQNITAGAYHAVRGVGIMLCLIGLIVFGVSFFLSGSQGIAEKKSQIGWKVIGLIIAIGAIPIMIFAESIANGIFG